MFNSQKTKAERTREGYYQEFVEKFKPKLTTDDCMTPELVYAAILAWARKEYGIGEDTRIARPFWPGEDYTQADYSGDCVVIDNPPFSKLSSICRYYAEKGLRFFLFAPSLTLFGGGFLLSKKAAAEKAAAEKAAAEKAGRIIYELSPREIEIVAGLGNSPAKNMQEAEPR